MFLFTFVVFEATLGSPQLKQCSINTTVECCLGQNVCTRCVVECPCDCGLAKLVRLSQNVTTAAYSSTSSNSDLASSYGIVLSIGLPSVGLLLIIFMLVLANFVHKRSIRRLNAVGVNPTDGDDPAAIYVSSLSLVYLERNNEIKEAPPNYKSIKKSSFVDKLPTYESFRVKKNFNQTQNV